LVSFSSLLPLIGPQASNRILTLPCGGRGHGQASHPSGGFPGRKEKKVRKAERKFKKEQEIAHQVWMGKDRDVVQEELESESSTDSDGEEESEEVEPEHEGDSVFMVVPRGTTATGTSKGSWTSSGAMKWRKHAADEDVVQAEEAKWA
jgi:hypothetical protein